jgi:hypothetical protein
MPIPLDARHVANMQGDFVPQHQNNWMIEIAGLDGDAKDLIVLSLVSFQLPTDRNEEVAIPYGNETRYVAGKATYDTVSLTVNDYVDRKVRKALLDWRKQVYDSETGLVGLPKDYKKTAEIILMASNGTSKRTCRLIGVWPQEVMGGQLDMNSADLVKVEARLRFDRTVWKV